MKATSCYVIIHIHLYPLCTGTVYGLVHSAQSIVSFMGPVVLNAIFYGTSRHMAGAVFLMSAGLLFIPLILLG